MIDFLAIQSRVLEKLGEDELRDRLPPVMTSQVLADKPDRYFLSAMTRRIFQAGMKHSVINDRWPFFEEWFWGFDPHKLVLLSEAQLEAAMQEPRLIRHWGKLRTIPVNASVMLELSGQYQGFGRYLADWPDSDIHGLWRDLAKRFERLGGDSGPRFLRLAGRDTYLLTPDVIAALKALDVIDGKPTRKEDRQRVTDQFVAWKASTGYPMAHLSRILSMVVG